MINDERRICTDTFMGGRFHLEMTENLGATRPFGHFEPEKWVLPDSFDEEGRIDVDSIWKGVL